MENDAYAFRLDRALLKLNIMTTEFPHKNALQYIGALATRAAVAAIALVLINTSLLQSAFADPPLPLPEYTLNDINGVDLLSLNLYLHQQIANIGSKAQPLTDTVYSATSGNWLANMVAPLLGHTPEDPYVGGADSFSPAYVRGDFAACAGWEPCTIVHFGSSQEIFQNVTSSGGATTYVAVQPTGATLTQNADGTFNYTERDGTSIIFYPPNTQGALPPSLAAEEVLYPDGRILHYWYNMLPDGQIVLTSITRSDGLQLHYTYGGLTIAVSNSTAAWQPSVASSITSIGTPSSCNGGNSTCASYWVLTSVTAINNAYEYCAPTALTCSLKMSWPTTSLSWSATAAGTGLLTITDPNDHQTVYTVDDDPNGSDYTTIGDFRTTNVQLPSGGNIAYTFCGVSCPWSGGYDLPINYPDLVESVSRSGDIWTYSASVTTPPSIPSSGVVTANGIIKNSVTDPAGASETTTAYDCNAEATYLPDWSPPPVITTAYDYMRTCVNPLVEFSNWQGETFTTKDYGFEIADAVMPEGNKTVYSWDARGNLQGETLYPTPSSSLSPINLSASYYPTCSNPLTCNEPNSTTDGNGNTTNYTYNASNGALASVSFPAVAVPNVGSVTPETVYTYVQRYAWVLNSSGSYVEAATPIWVRSTETYCRRSAMTSSGCAAGAADEVTKTFYYGPNSGPNNLFLRGVEVQSDGATHITCYGYDEYGNRISITKPNAGFTSLASCDQFTAQ